VESGKYINVKEGSEDGKQKIGLSVIGSSEVKKKKSLCLFVPPPLHTVPHLSLPPDLTLPKENSKEKPIYISTRQIYTEKSNTEQCYISVSYFVTHKELFKSHLHRR